MLRILGLFLLLLLGFAAWCYAGSVADPIVRRAAIPLPGLSAPIRVALISDIHVQGPDMPPERVARIVAQVNAERPDLVLLVGDFVGDRGLRTRTYSDAEIAAPLGRLRARLGVYAVLGNHDHWRTPLALRRALEAAGIRMLDNRVARVGGIALAGIGDEPTGHDDVPGVARAAMRLPEPLVAFTHSPDVIPRLPPRFALVLAGHTHCGQIVLPWHGALTTASRYGNRYRCGVIREGARRIVVGAGLGTSVLPFRLGAPPDWWLVTLEPGGGSQSRT